MHVCAYNSSSVSCPVPTQHGHLTIMYYTDSTNATDIHIWMSQFTKYMAEEDLGIDFLPAHSHHEYADMVIRTVACARLNICTTEQDVSLAGKRQYILFVPECTQTRSMLYHQLGHLLGLHHQAPPWALLDLHRLAKYMSLVEFNHIIQLYAKEPLHQISSCVTYHADIMDIGSASNMWFGEFEENRDASLIHFSEASLSRIRFLFGSRDKTGENPVPFDSYLSCAHGDVL